jgi:predicted acylesterase/phospholipase RssA
MAEPIRLAGKQPDVDPTRVGISYSGGGALVVIELGIASAFVKLGIVPAVISGVSAGSLAGAAHALDPVGGTGIRLAADILAHHVSNGRLGLTPFHVLGRLLVEREHIRSLGDNATIGPLVTAALKRTFGVDDVTIAAFGPPERPKLLIIATDVENRESVLFPDDCPLIDALVASSAIPGVFPWRTVSIAGEDRVLVDGGLVMNQPLSNLVEQGCGTIYACAVGPTDPLPPPKNALDNAMRAVHLAMHQATKLEEAYVQLVFKGLGKGTVQHIHPIINYLGGDTFDFTPDLVERAMADAEKQTIDWLTKPHGA